MLHGQIDNYLIVYIIIARLVELYLSHKNTNTLLSSGGVEYYSFHYKFIVIFHLVFVLYFLIYSFTFEEMNFNLLYLFIFIQFCRFKVIYDLGKYWTTRIIVVENKPLVRTGFYKFFKHPNYTIVIIEIILVCLIFKHYYALIYFTLIKMILLLIRINYEDKANLNRRTKFPK